LFFVLAETKTRLRLNLNLPTILADRLWIYRTGLFLLLLEPICIAICIQGKGGPENKQTLTKQSKNWFSEI